MRISDWSSDVCSSDLPHRIQGGRHFETSIPGQIEFMRAAEAAGASWVILQPPPIKGIPERELVRFFGAVAERAQVPVDRKSGGSGKSVSVRLDLGGRRILKKKNHRTTKEEM